MRAVPPEPEGPEPGDPVCWLHRLCAVCGAMPTAGSPDRCWRCDAPLDADDPDDEEPAVRDG